MNRWRRGRKSNRRRKGNPGAQNYGGAGPMPQRKRIFLKAVLLPAGPAGHGGGDLPPQAGRLGVRAGRGGSGGRDACRRTAADAVAARRSATRSQPRSRCSFFAGAAFTAGAGDQMVRLMDEDAAALEAAMLTGSPESGTAPDPESIAPEAAPERLPPRPRRPRRLPPRPRSRGGPRRGCTGRGAAGRRCTDSTRPRPSLPPKLLRRPPRRRLPSRPTRPPQPLPRRSEQHGSRPHRPARPLPLRRRPRPSARRAAKASPAKKWVVKRAAAPPAKAPEVEVERGGEPTIWLNRALPGSDSGVRPAAPRLREAARRQLEEPRRRLGRRARRPPRAGRAGRRARVGPRARRARSPDGGNRRLEGRARALRPDRLRRPRRRVRRPLPLRRHRGARQRLRRRRRSSSAGRCSRPRGS